MSDPNDPYRYEDVGEGMNPFGETIDDLEEVKKVLGEITEKFEKMSDSMDVFKKLEPVVKKMKSSKFGKATKKLGGMFKSMAGAIGSVGPMGLFMKSLKVIMDIFKPFQIILDIISGLIKVMVGSALGPMLEALQPLFDALLSLMPIFAKIGVKIGGLIAAFLEPLVELFIELMPAIEPILDIVVTLISFALIPLKAIFKAITPIIIALMPLIKVIGDILESLTPVFEILGGVIGWIIVLAMIPLIAAIYGVGIAIAALIDFFTLGIAGAMNSWNDLMLPILDTLGQAAAAGPQFGGDEDEPISGGAGGGAGRAGGIQEMAEGGIAMSHGIYELGEGGEPEMVIPLSKWEKAQSEQTALLGLMHTELVQTNYLNRKIIKTKEWNQAFRG